MKKTRKLLALVLAMLMALSCMAVPAMAHEDEEEIMPLGEVIRCQKCGGVADVTRTGPLYVGTTEVYCPIVGGYHMHDVFNSYVFSECRDCGHSEGSHSTSHSCAK